MTDLISRADAIEAVANMLYEEAPYLDTEVKCYKYAEKLISALPSADAVDCTDFIEWLVDRVLDETIWEYNSVAYGEIICRKLVKLGVLEVTEEPSYYIRPSAEAVPIHEDGTLEVKVPNAQKVGRVLVVDTDSHIGGGLFYPDDAVQGEWIHDGQNFKGGLDWCHCSECGYKTSTNGLSVYRYCPSCGARMTPYKGGDDE